MEKMKLKNMSSDELFVLAKEKLADERQKIEEENKQKIAEIREERRLILLRHKKEINAVNTKIKALGGKITGATASGKGRTGVSSAIIGLLEEVEQMDTKAIREKLEGLGVNVGNLGQSLAYLKGQGRVSSVGRGVYKKAD